MYDIHCHILPGTDDGPETQDDALEMARIAVADGIDTIIATPHGARIAEQGGAEFLKKQVRDFKDALEANEIPLNLLTGAEYLLSMELLKEAERGDAVALNDSRYLLVEIDFFQWPSYTADALFQLQLAGYTPILAHPERQANVQQSPDLLDGLVERGVLAEVTAGSVLGDFGGTAQRSAENLLKRGLVHFIASDGHSPTSNRPPVMAEAKEAVAALIGEEAAHLLAVSNPLAVLFNKPVQPPGIEAPRRRFLWFGRR